MYLDEANDILYVDCDSPDDVVAKKYKITNSKHITIGTDNTHLSIDNSNYINIGDNNDQIVVTNSTNINIGSANEIITIDAQNISVGNYNNTIRIYSDWNVVGDYNTDIEINSSQNEVISNCKMVSLRSDFSQLKDASNITTDNQSSHVMIDKSDDVNIVGSLSPSVNRSYSVSISESAQLTVRANDVKLHAIPSCRTFREDSTSTPLVVSDIHSDTPMYSDRNGVVVGRHGAPIPEAPQDNAPYVRLNGEWYRIDGGTKAGLDFIKATEKQ